MRPFSIRQGIIEMPPQLVREELSLMTRNRLSSCFQQALIRSSEGTYVAGYFVLIEPWITLCHGLHVNFFLERPSQFDKNRTTWIELLENFIIDSSWNEVLDLIEVVISSSLVRADFVDSICSSFESTGCAYRLIGERIETVASEEMAKSLENSTSIIEKSKFEGSKSHLNNSSIELRRGNWKQSVRESISSLESLLYDATGKKSFAKAIDTLKPNLEIHGALIEGWKKIYGYTSDKDGIRHAMLSESSQVDEHEAIYMYGACAGFVAYISQMLE